MGDTETSWHDHGHCKKNPDLFFAEQGEQDKTAAAIKICMRCPVRQPCREHALNRPERHGVWGGTTAKERERIRKLTRAA
ncbi:WhiB family transcriptional regulator [Rhodococcus hoagii]|nr:WhiB family transcriptional regulator [Prescottella equi]NKS56600.1 WhiB family transcriptional regulator [Prescottella equi]